MVLWHKKGGNMDYSFTIIIPVYNSEKYLRIMLDSIMNQTYSDWDMILVDDGSTDNSGKICDEYATKKIQVIHNPNQGQSMARRCGIDKASGDYTIVMDADDFVVCDCLENLNLILNEHSYDVVSFPYDYYNEELTLKRGTCALPSKIGEMGKEDFLSWVIETGNHGLVNKAIKTEIIKSAVSEVPMKRLKVNGDYIMIIPIICAANSFYFFNKSMYKYRLYGGSISHNYSFQHLIDTDFVSKFVYDVIQKHSIKDTKIKQTVVDTYINMVVTMLEKYMEKSTIALDDLKLLSCQEFFRNVLEYSSKPKADIYEKLVLFTIRKPNVAGLRLLHAMYPIEKIKIKVTRWLSRRMISKKEK